MSRSSLLFAGLFGTFAVSTYVMVLAPQAQLAGLQPSFTKEDDGKISDIYPIKDLSLKRGREVYVREGCMQCHTQQVRDEQNGTDLARGWGARRSVARDYIFDSPPLLGSLRLGPDLANAGAPDWRNEAKEDTQKPAKRDVTWELLHLYAPKTVVKDSNHPPYRYLFDEIKISGEKSGEALAVTGEHGPKPGYQIVPSDDARALAEYLIRLNHNHPLAEAGATTAAPATPAPAAAAPTTPAK